MKNLVLSALLFAGLTQAAGCIIVADDTTTGSGTGDVSVSWALKSSDAAGNIISSTCPPGADTIQILAQRGSDQPFTDKFLCSAPGGIADRLPVGQYAVWIQITDTQGVTKFAESAAQLVDIVEDGTVPISIDIFTDRAFFMASWHLTRGTPTSCAAVGADKVSVLATVTGGVNGFDDDKTPCTAGEDGKTILTTTPVPIGQTYTVVVAALNTVGESLGDSQPLTNQPLEYGNKFQDLGDVEIPIN